MYESLVKLWGRNGVENKRDGPSVNERPGHLWNGWEILGLVPEGESVTIRPSM